MNTPFNNNLPTQTEDVLFNPRNPVNPDSKIISTGNCLIFKLNHFKENIMIFSKNRAANPQASPSKSQTDKQSIPEAADGNTERLTVDAFPEHTANAGDQVAVPGVGGVLLSSTPEVSEVSNIDETTTAIS